MTNSIEMLKWRYATKKFDPTKKLSEAQLNTLKEALRLAPSSFGLQPWHFIVVEDMAVRKQLREAGHGQSQITDASHFFVLATDKKVDAALVEKYLKNIAITRNMSLESLEEFRMMMDGAIAMKGETGAKEWAVRQTYIALGVFLSVAAAEKIDATPMEGFDVKQFDAILHLEERGLTASVIAAVGFRAADDAYALLPKVRYAEKDVFTTV